MAVVTSRWLKRNAAQTMNGRMRKLAAEHELRGRDQQDGEQRALQDFFARPAHGAAARPAEEQRRDQQDAAGVALPPGPPVPEQFRAGQGMQQGEGQQCERRRDGRHQRRQRDELHHLLGAPEAMRHADVAPDQRRPGQRLDRAAGRDHR
jgi:hypothetical protein